MGPDERELTVTNLGAIDPLGLGYFAVEWAIRIIMLVVVPFRRSPEAARGWLLLVFFLPIPALVLYLIIGRPTYPRWRRRRFDAAQDLLARASREIKHSQHCCRPDLPERFLPAALLIEQLGQFPTLGSNSVEFLSDYDGMVDRLVADIENADYYISTEGERFITDDNANPPVCYNFGKCVGISSFATTQAEAEERPQISGPGLATYD